jgi:uncharacterized membrane protein YccC
MQWPALRDWTFAIKTFLAAMLALYIAFSLGLERPYWAMASAYIAAQPLSGATRSKAVFRLFGTIIGAAAAVALVPPLVDTPELLSLALALWVAACLYVALLDRTPRSYAGMLAGYTAAIIGFPAVSAPDAIFETALVRVEEIAIGVTIASLVANVIFPRRVGNALVARIDTWLGNARAWSRDALAGQGDPRQSARRLAADAVEINLLASHLSYEETSRETRHFDLLRARMIMLLPILSSIADRVVALSGRMPEAVAGLVADVSAWVRQPSQPAQALLTRIHVQEAGLSQRTDWTALVLTSLLMRLRDLVQLVHDCTALHRAIDSGAIAEPALLFAPEATAASAWHRDPGMALLSAVACLVAILLACTAWIATAWQQGYIAAEMVAVACSFFAAQDDPVPAILNFLVWSVVGVVVDGVLLFGVLPGASGFPTLVLALAPPFIIAGILTSMPATANSGRALAANGATMLALQDAYRADLPSFVNSALAFILGLALAAIVTRLIRSVGAGVSAGRLLRVIWQELAVAAERRGGQDRARYAGLMLDRLGLIGPRLAETEEEVPANALSDIRVGLNIIDLRRARHGVSTPVRARIDALLDALAAAYRKRPRRRDDAAVLARVDDALAALTAAGPQPGRSDALLGLVGVRLGLFPDAAAP